MIILWKKMSTRVRWRSTGRDWVTTPARCLVRRKRLVRHANRKQATLHAFFAYLYTYIHTLILLYAYICTLLTHPLRVFYTNIQPLYVLFPLNKYDMTVIYIMRNICWLRIFSMRSSNKMILDREVVLYSLRIWDSWLRFAVSLSWAELESDFKLTRHHLYRFF